MILTGGAGQRALDRAFEEAFGVSSAFRSIPMAGRTDPLIIEDACAAHAIAASPSALARLQQGYYDYLAEELPRDVPGKRVLPGVVPLLEALRTDSATTLALLTGNLPRSARLKLEHFGLWQYFVTGAFGDDAEERDGLVPVALGRVAALGRERVPAHRIVLIGDTPHDVACARAGGVRSLAVATGRSTVEELYEAGADAAVSDLSRTKDILRLIEALTDSSRRPWGTPAQQTSD